MYLKAHGLEQVEGLKDYILNNDKLNMSSVNELITSQNNANIANQAHGFKGVKKAIDEYNESLKQGSKNTDGITSAISTSNIKLGNYLENLNKTKANIWDYAKSLAVASAKSLALNVATTALNMGVSLLVSKGIEFLVTGITNYINRAEIAREKSIELTEAWNTEEKSINDSISRYNELAKKLEENTLSTEEVKSAKEELASIQDTLVSKYGQEALGIDLVNGKRDEEIKKLRELSKEKANAYVSENYSNIKADKEYLTEDFNINKDLGYGANGVSLDSSLGFEIEKFLKQYENIGIKSFDLGNGSSILRLWSEGTREEVYNELNQLFADLTEAYGESNPLVNNFKETLSNSLSDFDTEAINKAKENVLKYAEANILSGENTRNIYSDAVDAVSEYNEAILSGDGIEEAKKNLDEVKSQVETSLGEGTLSQIDNADKVFNNLWNNIYEGASTARTSLDEFGNNPFSFEEQITQIQALSKGFSQLDEIMADVLDGKDFDYSSIINNDDFKDVFGEYTEEYENFIKVITNSPDDISKCKDSFNQLAGAYIYGSGALENLTEESKDAAILELTQMGLDSESAIEAVNFALGKYTKALEIAKKYSLDLENQSLSTNASLILEGNIVEEDAKALFDYALQKELCAENPIRTVEDCQALLNLAKQANATAEVLQLLIRLKNSMSVINSDSWGEATKDIARKEVDSIMAELKTVKLDASLDFSGGSKTNEIKEKAQKAAKDTSDAWLEAFEKELKALKDLRDRGIIDESTYLDRLKALYTNYFADRKKYLDEFNKYEREYLEGMESLYNSAISAVVKLKDKKIDSAKESKESVIKNLEAEKDTSDEAYQAQIDAIKNLTDEKERYIDGIKAEIDSIQGVIDGYNEQIDLINAEIKAKREANDERKRALDLEQAQFDLEKKRNNKTIRQYTQNGIIYTEDSSVVREAEQKVEDAKLEIEIAEKEKEISRIEELIKQKEKEIEQKEKSISLIEKEIDILDKQTESIQKAQEESEKYYDNLIKQQENYYNSLIENLEKEKSKWEELAEVKEVADAYSAIEQVFGDLGYTVDDVLNNSMGAFEDFKAKYIDLLNTMNSNDSFGNGLSYAVDELDKSLANVGTNTEGLDNLVSKMDDVTTSVGNVSNAINGSGISSMSSGEETSNVTGSSLKDAIAEQTSDALAKLEEQSNAFSNGEDSLEGSVQNVIDKVAGSSEGKDKKDSKEGESEVDTDNLIGAIQAQYDKTVETIPQQIESFNLFESAIGGCVTQLHAMIEALERVQALSSSVGMMGTVPINGYATGTTHAKKGLSIVGEEEPELIEDAKGNLSLVTEPTLLNMEGGEKVYNGEETEKLLKPKHNEDGTITLPDDIVIKPLDDTHPAYKMYKQWQDYYAKHPEVLYPTQNVWSMQMQNLLSSPKPIHTVNNVNREAHVIQNINVTMPNITNETGFRNFEREMQGFQLKAMQQCHRR